MSTNVNKNPFDEDEYGDYQIAPTIEDDYTEDVNNNIYIGEKHTSKNGDYYDIEISNSFHFIKLYHSNRNIDMERTKTMVQKYKVKEINFPPLTIAHIVDSDYDKDEYVLREEGIWIMRY